MNTLVWIGEFENGLCGSWGQFVVVIWSERVWKILVKVNIYLIVLHSFIVGHLNSVSVLAKMNIIQIRPFK